MKRHFKTIALACALAYMPIQSASNVTGSSAITLAALFLSSAIVELKSANIAGETNEAVVSVARTAQTMEVTPIIFPQKKLERISFVSKNHTVSRSNKRLQNHTISQPKSRGSHRAPKAYHRAHLK